MGFLTGTRCSRPARQRLPVRSDDTRGRAVFHCLQLGLLAALLCGANVASAGTAPPLIVTTTIDKNDGICSADCSLREAIGTANVRAGTDTIIMASGDYVLSGVLGDLEFAGNVVLDGSAGNVEINGSALPRIVQLERGVSAEIHGAELIGRVVDFIGTGTGGQLLLSGATVRVIGETVTGDITYREGAGGIEVAIDSATLALALNEGQPDTVGVRLANARGAAVEIGAGMAGVISGNASLEGTAATLSGPLEYRYNDTDTAIDTTVATAFGDVAVAVPEFVRDVSGTTIAIGLVDAPQLSANLHFEFTDLDGTAAIAIGIGAGAIAFGSGAVAGIDVSGAGLLLESGQLALSLSLTPAFPAGVDFDSAINTLEINSAVDPVAETFNTGSGVSVVSVGGGPSTAIIASGALLGVAGAPAIAGDFEFEEITVDGDAAVAVRIPQGQFSLGNGKVDTVDFSGNGVILDSGQIALDEEVALHASIPGVDLTPGTARLQLNSRPPEVSKIIDFGGGPLALDLPTGPFARIVAPLSNLRLSGGPLLNANLTLEEVDLGGSPAVTILVEAGALTMASGTIAVADLAGVGVVLDSGAFGLSATGQAALTPPLLSLGEPGTVIINSAMPPFSATVMVAGEPEVLDLPDGGPYTRLQIDGAIGLNGGPPINGALEFEELDVGGGTGATVNIDNGTLTLGGGAVSAVGLDGTGLLLPSGQLALALAGSVDFAAPGLALASPAIAELNSTDVGVSELFNYGGFDLPLELPAGPFTRITTAGNDLSAAGFGTFTGDFMIIEAQSGMQALAQVSGENVTTAPGGVPPLLNDLLNGTLLPDGSYAFAAAADDGDGDGFESAVDNCEADFNPFQADSNGDGIGDVCELVAVPAAGGAAMALLGIAICLLGTRLRRPI